MFEVGKVYNRRKDLHEVYGGQEQGGISTPASHPVILIFTGESGSEYGYRDSWDGDTFSYTGEGQKGDMSLIRGNRAIAEHVKDGKKLHIFRTVKGGAEYLGEMEYVSHSFKEGRDVEGKARKIIVFQLERVK
jgi:5-methylcytosine-specific restriction enzyme A